MPCPTCRLPVRQLSVEVARTTCWSCRRQLPVLDFVDCTDDEPVLIAASCPEIPGAKSIGAARRVSLEVRHSAKAGGSYLMHLCPHCKRMQGDNFLYAIDGAVTAIDVPPTPMTLCENGHLIAGQERPWPQGSTAQRPSNAVGLVGEPAHLFSPGPRGDVSVTRVTPSNTRRIARRMVGLDD
jgi:hypothetical protein